MKKEYKDLFELILDAIIREVHPYDICYFHDEMFDTKSKYRKCYKSHRVAAMNYFMEFKEQIFDTMIVNQHYCNNCMRYTDDEIEEIPATIALNAKEAHRVIKTTITCEKCGDYKIRKRVSRIDNYE